MRQIFANVIASLRPTQIAPTGLVQKPRRKLERGALILLLDRKSGGLEVFLDDSGRLLRRFSHVVFVTSDSDLRPFHRRGLIAELVPSLAEIASDPGRGAWLSYLARRREIIQAKWTPRWQLAYGPDWQDYFDEVRALTEFAPRLEHF